MTSLLPSARITIAIQPTVWNTFDTLGLLPRIRKILSEMRCHGTDFDLHVSTKEKKPACFRGKLACSGLYSFAHYLPNHLGWEWLEQFIQVWSEYKGVGACTCAQYFLPESLWEIMPFSCSLNSKFKEVIWQLRTEVFPEKSICASSIFLLFQLLKHFVLSSAENFIYIYFTSSHRKLLLCSIENRCFRKVEHKIILQVGLQSLGVNCCVKEVFIYK